MSEKDIHGEPSKLRERQINNKNKSPEVGTKEKLKKYEVTIRHRVECEEKSFHIINRLIDDCVEPQYLMDCGKFITQDNYNDIVEERAISNLCGYPLCNKGLKNVPKQKYHISTRSNKVYDITERKNFCKNQCFKASRSFGMQIPESPVWARGNEPTPVFTLDPHLSGKGIIGTEVVGEQPWQFLKDEIEFLQELDSKQPSSTRRQDKFVKRKEESENRSSIKKSVSPPKQNSVDDEESKGSITSESCSPLCPTYETRVPSDDHNPICNFEKLSIQDPHPCRNTVIDKGLANPHALTVSSEKPGRVETETSKDLRNIRETTDLVSGIKDSGETKRNVSQLERLNMLLAKKKNVLSKMLDIQEVATTTAISPSNKSNRSLISETETDIGSDSTALRITEDIRKPVCDSHSASSLKTCADNSDTVRSPPKNKVRTSFQKLSPLNQVSQKLQPWITEKTRQYLKTMGEPLEEVNANHPTNFSDPKIQSGYVNLCKRLDLEEQGIYDGPLEELSVTSEEAKSKSAKRQTLPDYALLKEESEKFQIKVSEFITGKRAKDQESLKSDKEGADRDPVYLPTIDSYDQKIIRAKIVLDRLDKTVPEILVPMGLTAQDVSCNLRELIYTCRLERDNVVFKPSEWMLIALILLKMLVPKVKSVQSAFQREATLNYLNILLNVIGHSHQDLDSVVDSLISS